MCVGSYFGYSSEMCLIVNSFFLLLTNKQINNLVQQKSILIFFIKTFFNNEIIEKMRKDKIVRLV